MKKILFIILLLVSLDSFGQNKSEGDGLLDYLCNKLDKHITFLQYEEKKDSVRIHRIIYYDSKKEKYIEISQTDIKEKYPELIGWFTTKSYSPLSVSNRSNINKLNIVDSHNLRNRSYPKN